MLLAPEVNHLGWTVVIPAHLQEQRRPAEQEHDHGSESKSADEVSPRWRSARFGGSDLDGLGQHVGSVVPAARSGQIGAL
jgi:hypothetical protein